jgi:hypothetical protein
MNWSEIIKGLFDDLKKRRDDFVSRHFGDKFVGSSNNQSDSDTEDYPGKGTNFGNIGKNIDDPWLRDLYEGNLNYGMTEDNIANGYVFSNTDFMNMQFELNKINQNQQWQEDMYNKYSSLPAQVAQMRQAGLNPALMYGSGASGGQVSSSGASGGSPTGGSGAMTGQQKAQMIMSTIMQLLGTGSQFAQSISHMKQQSYQNSLLQSEKDYTDAKKDNMLLQNEYDEIRNKYAEAEKKLGLESTQSNINYLNANAEKLLAEVLKIKDERELINSEIEVNGHKIKLMCSEMNLNEAHATLANAQTLMTNLTREQSSQIFKYNLQMAEAQIKMTNATSYSLRQQGNKAFYDAKVSMLEYMKMEELLDAGYVEQLIRNMKTERGTKIANTVIYGISSIVGAVADFTPFGALGGSSPMNPDMFTSASTLNF